MEIGSPVTRFLVHSQILRQSAPLFALASKKQPITLPGLSPGHGHTLVHHLYTGTFERKRHYAPYGIFSHSTRVYCAAIRYELPALAELSKDEIVQAGEGLSVTDILSVAKNYAFPALPENDMWYAQYLEEVIQKAMEKDPEPFKQPDFITRVEGNSRLLQIVWKTVMSSYASASVSTSSTRDLESGAETPLAESTLAESEVTTQDSLHQLPSPTESVVDSPPTSKEMEDLIEPQKLALDSSEPSDLDTVAQELEGVVPATHNDSTENDDFGLPDIEPIVSQAEVVHVLPAPVEDSSKPHHVRADSVVEEDAVAPVALNEATTNPSNATPELAKKSKKKGKKKHSSIMFN